MHCVFQTSAHQAPESTRRIPEGQRLHDSGVRKDHGFRHELWTTRLLARHARKHGPEAGYECLAHLVQGTVCKLLGQQEIKSHKARYYLERGDAEWIVGVGVHGIRQCSQRRGR
ncbi:hypothetical protein J2R96_002058 [Bradyrhizobium elkanii]|nr:hypothetical protein [Bradyrhizobium elkanii]